MQINPKSKAFEWRKRNLEFTNSPINHKSTMKQKIGKVSLKNSGLFLAKIQFKYTDGQGVEKLSEKSENIVTSQTNVVDPGELGVPDGASITLKVDVVLGNDNTASNSFLYEKSNTLYANYEIEGTIFSNTLTFLNVAEPVWENWSKNLVYQASGSDQSYFYPVNKSELQTILGKTSTLGIASVRVSGQRHSQPPLVADDNRENNVDTPLTWIIDLSCYKDLGEHGDEKMVFNDSGTTVTVNTGVREDELGEFLTANNKMFPTVSAGGFFSIGGMIAVDVNGATVDSPIFAETACAFTIMGQDGNETTIDIDTTAGGDFKAIQFARVSLGALGIVTSVTLNILDRPYANTLNASKESFVLSTEEEFVNKFKTLLTTHDRVETFFNPYSGKYMSLIWDIDNSPSPTVANNASSVPTACELADEGEYGAPNEGPIAEPLAEAVALKIQKSGSKLLASGLLDLAYLAIEGMFKTAQENYSDMWLTKAARVIFMSYFVELPGGITDEGLSQAWKGLNAVTERLNASDSFMIAGPMEFRFMKGGDAVMAGTYNENSDTTYINLDLIGFTDGNVEPADYSPELLQFFADIEREWVDLGGLPHNGKMYGFYDPSAAIGTHTAPFNQAFLKSLTQSRIERVTAFDNYRKQLDPNNVFSNKYVKTLLSIT